MERWRTIDGFPAYSVSDHGRVRRDTAGRRGAGFILKCTPSTQTGYPVVNLYQFSDDGERQSRVQQVHVLVATAFVGPKPTPRHEVAHADGTRTNGHFSNLRWATRRENIEDKIKHGRQHRGSLTPNSKLNEEQVAYIKESPLPHATLAQMYGVCKSHISHIKIGWRGAWRHV